MEPENNVASFKRDWLLEAIGIAEGRSGMKPKKEHLDALYKNFLSVSAEHKKLCTLLQSVLVEVQKKRVAEGLSVLPPPGRLASLAGDGKR